MTKQENIHDKIKKDFSKLFIKYPEAKFFIYVSTPKEDKSIDVTRISKNILALELMGIMTQIQLDISKQMDRESEPTKVVNKYFVLEK